MREILFRGKRIDNGEWVYGGYYHEKVGEYFTAVFIVEHLTSGVRENHRVDPATVGQFTGMTDKNGKKIFEGDVLHADNGSNSSVIVVLFGEFYPKMFYDMLDLFCSGLIHIPALGFHGKSVKNGEELLLFQSPCMSVIGNIHDNPELVEG